MGQRPVDPEMEKNFRGQSKRKREAPADTLSRMVRALMRSDACHLETGEPHRLEGRCNGPGWSAWSGPVRCFARSSWPLWILAADNAA